MTERKAYFLGLRFAFIWIWRVRPSDHNRVTLEWIVVSDSPQFVLSQVSDQKVCSGEDFVPIRAKGPAGQQPDIVVREIRAMRGRELAIIWRLKRVGSRPIFRGHDVLFRVYETRHHLHRPKMAGTHWISWLERRVPAAQVRQECS